jgi:outer membrane protein TolC
MEQCRACALEQNKELVVAGLTVERTAYDVKAYRTNFYPQLAAAGFDFASTARLEWNLMDYATGLLGSVPQLGEWMVANQVSPDVLLQGVPENLRRLEAKVGNFFGGGIYLKQPIYMGGKITAAYRMAQIGNRMSVLNRRLTNDKVLVAVDEAFALMVKAQESGKVAQEYHALLQELLRNVESAYRHGLKTRNDVLKVQVKLNESELNLLKAQNALRVARMNLLHIMGLPLTESVELSLEELKEQVNSIPAPDAMDISGRAETSLLSEKVALMQQQVKLTRSDHLPQVGLMAGVSYMNGLKLNDERLIDDGAASAMVSVKVPLYHFGEMRYKVRSAKLKAQEAETEKADLEEQMLLEVNLAANSQEESALEVKLTESSIAQATENLKVTRKNYDNGLETLSNLLEAQTLWQQAECDYIQALCELFVNHTKYLKASGRLQ